MQARYQHPIISPGAILREERKLGTALGIEAEKHTNQGKLAPADLVNAVMEAWLDRHDGSFVFDGYPRSIEQANALEQMLSDRNAPLDVVLSLEVDFDTIKERVARRVTCPGCGRAFIAGRQVPSASDPCPNCGGTLGRRHDDQPETLELRMREYADKTEPLVDYYSERTLLRSVDARPEPEVVFRSIVEILEAP